MIHPTIFGFHIGHRIDDRVVAEAMVVEAVAVVKPVKEERRRNRMIRARVAPVRNRVR
jgi:hypothetical protein